MTTNPPATVEATPIYPPTTELLAVLVEHAHGVEYVGGSLAPHAVWAWLKSVHHDPDEVEAAAVKALRYAGPARLPRSGYLNDPERWACGLDDSWPAAAHAVVAAEVDALNAEAARREAARKAAREAHHAAALERVCKRCGAEPGAPCLVTVGPRIGQPKRDGLHDSRYRAPRVTS